MIPLGKFESVRCMRINMEHSIYLFYYPNIYGDNSNLEIEKIKNLCYDLLNEYGDIDESPVDNEGSFHIFASTCGTNEV